MKKVGIITIHKAYNYGAALQSFALQKKMQSLGVDAEVIDFDPPQMVELRKVFAKCNSVKNILRNVRALFTYKKIKERAKKFQKFMSENMVLSQKTYTNGQDFIDFPPKYDCLVTGSDQTFCLHLGPNVDEMKPYFLENVEGKKVSYASSFGEKIKLNTKQEEEWIAKMLTQYQHLSVREDASADYVNKLTGMQAQVVLDPTLLLQKDEWSTYEKPTKHDNDKYILFYSVLSDKWVVEYVKEFSRRTNLKLIAIHQKNAFEFSCGFQRCINIGPGEFLSFIKNAEYVVTTSFHATVFSLIYNKRFSSLILGEGNRLTSLLKLVGLESRLIRKGENNLSQQFNEQIDYDSVHKTLCIEREKSLNYLKNALGINDEASM